MKSDAPYNQKWTDAVFTYLKVAEIVLVFVRPALAIMAFKWPWLTQYFMYFQLLQFMVV